MVKLLHIGAGHCEEYDIYIERGVEQVIYVEAVPYLVKEGEAKMDWYNRKCNRNDKIYHALLWCESGITKKFRLFNNDTFASVYDINPETWPWSNIKNGKWDVELETLTLDDFLEKQGIVPGEYECMAIDVQGSEYDVFVGGENYLKGVKCIRFEASTKEFYKNQKVYSELREYLESKSFILEDITSDHTDIWAWRAGYEDYRKWLEK